MKILLFVTTIVHLSYNPFGAHQPEPPRVATQIVEIETLARCKELAAQLRRDTPFENWTVTTQAECIER